MTQDSPTAERLADASPAIDRVDEDELLPQLVAHLREHRSRLREEWANRIHRAHLLASDDAAGDRRRNDLGLR